MEEIKVVDIKTNQIVIPNLQDRILGNLSAFHVPTTTSLKYFQSLLDIFNDPNLKIIPVLPVYECLEFHFHNLWTSLDVGTLDAAAHRVSVFFCRPELELLRRSLDDKKTHLSTTHEDNLLTLNTSKVIVSLVKIHLSRDCVKAVKYAQKFIELLDKTISVTHVINVDVLSELFRTFGDVFLEVQPILSSEDRIEFLSSLLKLQSRYVILAKPHYFESLHSAAAALLKQLKNEFQATKILEDGYFTLFPDFVTLMTQAETLLKFQSHLPAFKVIHMLENMIKQWQNQKVGDRVILIQMVFTLGQLYYKAGNLHLCQYYMLLYCRLITEILVSENMNPSNLRKALDHALEMAQIMYHCYTLIRKVDLKTCVYGSELLILNWTNQAKHYRSIKENEKSCDCTNAIIVMCHTTLITSGALQVQMWSLYYNLAIDFMHLKRYLEALEASEFAGKMGLKPKDLLFYEIQAYCYQEIKYHEEAEQAYVHALLKAIDEPSKASIYAKMGLNCYATGNLQKAKTYFESAMKNRTGFKLLDFEKNIARLLISIYAFFDDDIKLEKMRAKLRKANCIDTEENTLDLSRQCLWKKDFKMAKLWFKIGKLPQKDKNEAFLSQIVSCINLKEEMDTEVALHEWRLSFCTLPIFLFNIKETFKIPTMRRWIQWDFLNNAIHTKEFSNSKDDLRTFRNSCAIYEQFRA